MANRQIGCARKWTRRSVVFSGTAVLATGLSLRWERAAGQAEPDGCQPGLGLEACRALYRKRCLLPPGELRQFSLSLSPSLTSQAPAGEAAALSSAQLASFDKALKSNVLGPLTHVFELTPPDFRYYDDGNAPNAMASADDTGANTAVLVGQNLLQHMLAQGGGDYAVMAVCAHEFGHLKQYQSAVQRRIASELPCYCIELHADFLAGFFIRRFKASFSGADIQRIGRVWQSWPTTSCTHGSNVQRTEAIEAGFNFAGPQAQRSIGEAVEFGVKYLRKYA
jgi:hypothetical protein